MSPFCHTKRKHITIKIDDLLMSQILWKKLVGRLFKILAKKKQIEFLDVPLDKKKIFYPHAFADIFSESGKT